MKKVKIAQIGIGHDHALMIFDSLKKQSDIFEIVGYALPESEEDKFPEKMHVFKGYKKLSVQEILSDPEIDAVTIETEEWNLTHYAQMAAEYGKHMHMDKPGGMELSDFEKLIDTVRHKGLVFHLGYVYRYNPYVQEVLQRIKRGELGEIISVEAQMNCIHTPQKRQWLGNFKGGMMFFLGCHLIDLILQIQGEPKRILPMNTCTGTDGVTAQDYGMVIFEYEKGISFAKTNAREHGGFARRQIVITGTKETVEIKPLEWFADGKDGTLLYTERVDYKSTLWTDKGTKERTEPFDRYDGMMAAFAEMCNGKRENPYSYDYELELYKTVLKCCEMQ